MLRKMEFEYFLRRGSRVLTDFLNASPSSRVDVVSFVDLIIG